MRFRSRTAEHVTGGCSALSSKLAPCDLSTLMPPSTASHDCPNTVFGESCTANCSYGNVAIAWTASATVLTCGSDGALVSDPTLPYPNCGALMCSIGYLLLNWLLRVATCTKGYEADGSISTTSLRCLSSGEFVSDAQTVYPSCSQMLCSDTLRQSGVGANSSCRGASVGDTCIVFCAEEYRAVSNDTSTVTCAYNSSCDVIASLRVDFSKCFSLTYNETCVVHCSVGYTGVDDKNTLEFIGDSDVHLHGLGVVGNVHRPSVGRARFAWQRSRRPDRQTLTCP